MIFRKNTTFYCACALDNMMKVRNKQKAWLVKLMIV
jgi:hypothetical protein